ncbi:MAG: hypothetical protein J0I14_03930 [Propionibacteriaceae bacterium]|nr:hypothetical protein [Propionibacteriaceae bacterium]
MAFEPRVRALLEEYPDLPATVLAERVGWTGSMTWFRENVTRLRPEHRRVDPANRLTWEAGDAAQCDLWFPPKKIPLANGMSTLLPVLVMTAAGSRFVLARTIPTKTTEDLLLGTWQPGVHRTTSTVRSPAAIDTGGRDPLARTAAAMESEASRRHISAGCGSSRDVDDRSAQAVARVGTRRSLGRRSDLCGVIDSPRQQALDQGWPALAGRPR